MPLASQVPLLPLPTRRLPRFDDRRRVLLLEGVAVADVSHRAVAVLVRELEVALRDELRRDGGLGLFVLARVLEAAGDTDDDAVRVGRVEPAQGGALRLEDF